MIFNKVRVLAFIVIVVAWIFLTFFFIGCSNVSYRTIPNGMCEDAQDYSTKYNIMDSPDGSKNPNAQVNFLQLKY